MEWFETNAAPIWKLKDGANQFLLSESEQSDNLTMEVSLAKLNLVLDQFGSGRFFIECKKKVDQTKNLLKTHFQFHDASSSTSTSLVATTDQIELAVQRGITDFKKDLLIKELEDKINANGDTSAIDRIVENLEPYLESILTDGFGITAKKSSSVSGNPTSNVSKAQQAFNETLTKWKAGNLHDRTGDVIKHPEEQDQALGIAFSNARKIDKNFADGSRKKKSKIGSNNNKPEHQVRVENAVRILAENDPDIDIVLEKLANLIVNDPEKYKMAKNLLG